MQTITIDKTGKIYLPKAIRQKVKEKTYAAAVLPNGTIMLHSLKRIKDPKKALREFQKLPKVTKSLSKIKKEIHEEAMKDVK